MQPNKEDILNLNNDNNNKMKKPLIYGAIAFLVFIIGVLGYGILSNSKKDENVVLPPQIKQTDNKSDDAMFKEVPIQNDQQTNDGGLATKLLDEKPKPTQTVSTKKESPKITVKPKKSVTKTNPVGKKEYYIQVAALMKYKKPNKKFLELIKKEGYHYRFYSTYYIKNGKKIEVTKILIGPYDEQTARKLLPKVKENITQNAFIFKVK